MKIVRSKLSCNRQTLDCIEKNSNFKKLIRDLTTNINLIRRMGS